VAVLTSRPAIIVLDADDIVLACATSAEPVTRSCRREAGDEAGAAAQSSTTRQRLRHRCSITISGPCLQIANRRESATPANQSYGIVCSSWRRRCWRERWTRFRFQYELLMHFICRRLSSYAGASCSSNWQAMMKGLIAAAGALLIPLYGV
jgi:hypothetical protein